METEDDRQEAQIWKKLSKRFEEEAQTRIAAEAVAEKAAENKVCVRARKREREREREGERERERAREVERERECVCIA